MYKGGWLWHVSWLCPLTCHNDILPFGVSSPLCIIPCIIPMHACFEVQQKPGYMVHI